MDRLIISPDVFIFTKEQKGVIYNAETQHGFLFDNTTRVAELVSKLQVPENLYSLLIEDDKSWDAEINDFVCMLTATNCGKIISDSEALPLSLKPILKIQDDTNYYRSQHRNGIDSDVFSNLHSIVLNVGSEKGIDLYAKQIPYPIKRNSNQIDVQGILIFIDNCRVAPFLSEISVIGNPSDILDDIFYTKVKDIAPLHFFIPDVDLISHPYLAENLKDYGDVTIVVQTSLHSVGDINGILASMPEADFLLTVESDRDFDVIDQVIGSTATDNIKIVPLYNGINKDFIKSTCQIAEEHLLDGGPDKREIFLHQTLNIFDFGKLYIQPSGKIYTNMCSQEIGDIYESPCGIVYKELTNGISWLNNRNIPPCVDCMFRYLCPSLSNYERLYGGPLCFRYS